MGGWAAFPQFPLDQFKVLVGLAHSQAIWPQPWQLKHCRELGSFLSAVPSLHPWLFCPWGILVVVPVPWPTDVLHTEAVCPRLVWPLWELGGQECSCLSPPMASLSGAIWGAGWAVALTCLCQGGHQFGNLLPQSHSALYRFCGHGRPSPYLIMGFFILTLCLVSSNHQLGMSGPGVAIKISY